MFVAGRQRGRSAWGAVVLLAAGAGAQGFNVSFNNGPPTDAYGAAASQPGRWNLIMTTFAQPSWTLIDLSGAATSVVLALTPVVLDGNAFDNPDTTGDDEALMDGYVDLNSIGNPVHFTFTNLANGHYRVFTYAWAPDNPVMLSRVWVDCSPDPGQIVGGAAWPGGQVPGITYAEHVVEVTGGVLALHAEAWFLLGTVNGLQLVRTPEVGTPYCVGDGSLGPCPCGNQGLPGRGCDNAQGTGGARIDAFGVPSVGADGLTLAAVHLPNQSSALLFQSDASAAPTPLGDGLICAGGAMLRLQTLFARCGQVSFPRPGDAPLTVLGGIPPQGGTRHYQAYYRNPPDFCTAATFNVTSGVSVVWAP